MWTAGSSTGRPGSTERRPLCTLHAVRRVGEPFTFGLDPAEVSGYLADRGFGLEWDSAVSDAAARLYPAGTCPSVPAYYHVAGARRC